MKCPNCNNDLEKVSICPHCGIDPVLFDKTTYISNKFYNRGLSEALVGNLTSAIDSLCKSVEYNKFNYQARNLLGLIYYEIGMVGDALKHWVISAGYNKKENPATTYIDDIQANNRLLEKFSDSIMLYNKALEDLRLRNEDMAIIQLKKALEENPKFVEAMNLLTTCYIYQKSFEKAFVLTEKTLEIDNGNIKALSYYKKLNAVKTKPSIKTSVIKEPKKQRYTDKRVSGNSFYLTEIIIFLLGSVCAFGIFYMLIIPDMKNRHEEEITKLNTGINQMNQIHYDELSEKENVVLALEGDIARLSKSNEQLNDEIELQTRINRLHQASVHLVDEEYEEAAGIIEKTDITNFNTSAMRIYNHVKETSYQVLEKNFYDEGLRAYNSRRYAEASELFEKSLVYLTANSSYVDDNYYYLGRIAEVDGDKISAKLFYDIIINDYPNSNQASNARSRLRNL